MKHNKKKMSRAAYRCTALLCALVLVLGSFGGCTMREPETENKTENQSSNKKKGKSFLDLFNFGFGSSKKTEETTDEAFLEKANYLKMLIDVYYWKEADDEALYEGMYHGLVDALGDPYSYYFTPTEYDELNEELEGVYCGIGALVSQDPNTKEITIVRPFVNGPAYSAGILPGDILTHIDGENIAGWDINLAVSRMKGEQGTEVKIKVWRSAINDYVEKTVVRDFVEVETVTYEMLADSIGYISVMEFGDQTDEQFESAVRDLMAQGAKGLVVDIRDNGGGLLTTVVNMLDLFLEKGLIVYTMDKNNKKDEIKAKKGSITPPPMAVLINGNSASASEIFAGALQDYELATVVGTQSFGKGIVQSVIPLSDGSAIKLTVSTYYTPLGRCIHEVGVTPDVVVELDADLRLQVVVDPEEDNQVQAAIAEVKKRMK